MTLQKIIRYSAGIWVLLGAFFCTSQAQAAVSLYVSPAGGTYVLGSTFTVSLFLNTGGDFVNAVEANLSFPPDKLQVVSPSTGKSVIQIWVNQPGFSNTEGTLRFQGVIPYPGINTDAGVISTVTFRVKNIGTAAIKVLDTSRVLLSDGQGTDVLSQRAGGIYQLSLPPPEGPLVISLTHPDQEKWYGSPNVVLEWNSPTEIQGYSYVLSDNPADEPDDVSEGARTRVVYSNVSDGIHYFHIKSLRSGSWGGVTHFKLGIDKTKPAAFKVNFSPSRRTSNRRPVVDFGTTDTMSGLDHYELKVIPLDPQTAFSNGESESTPFFIETTPPYAINVEYGRYHVLVRAFDRAGNYYQAEERLEVVKPLFEFILGDGLRIAGQYTLPWLYVILISIAMVLLLVFFVWHMWKLHRRAHERLKKGALDHPAVAEKLEELKSKQSEYGDATKLMVILIVAGLSVFLLAGKPVVAATTNSEVAGQAVPLAPPIITLFPAALSNDEILYIGGRASAPRGDVLVYFQEIETGATLTATTVADENGAWFYSFPEFLNVGKYIVWAQLRAGEEMSPPSPRMDVTVSRTALQIGRSRLSYQDFYLGLLIFLAVICAVLLGFFLYHFYHFRAKHRRFTVAVREAEDSIRRGFALLRRDIEDEISVIKKAKLTKELSAEESIREEKLVRDLEQIGEYIGEEVWQIEKLQE